MLENMFLPGQTRGGQPQDVCLTTAVETVAATASAGSRGRVPFERHGTRGLSRRLGDHSGRRRACVVARECAVSGEQLQLSAAAWRRS